MQKLKVWTAGVKSRKVRGVRVKTWVNLQLLLNYKGVRVDINKTGGLFRKRTGRTGILGSRPLDLDPSAPGEGVRGI